MRHVLNRWLFSLTLLLALFAAVRPLHAQEQPPSLQVYEAWLREAFAAAQRNDRIGLDLVAPRLIAAREVTFANGSVAVDNSWLERALAEPEADLQAISQRLGALIDALSQRGSDAPADAATRLASILNRPPFNEQPQRTPTFFGDLLDWLFRQLSRILEPFFRVGVGSANGFAWLATIVGGILILAVMAYILLRLRRSLVRDASAAHDDPEANLTASTARDQAAELARSGDYRTAVRYMYLSALLWLDERELLRYDRALTNREYLEHLRDNADLRNRLLPIVETFDRVWYGYAQLDAQSFEAYRRQVEALRQ